MASARCDFRSLAQVIRSGGDSPSPVKHKRPTRQTPRYLHNTSLFLLPQLHEQPHVNGEPFFFVLPFTILLPILSFCLNTKNAPRIWPSSPPASLPPLAASVRTILLENRILERRRRTDDEHYRDAARPTGRTKSRMQRVHTRYAQVVRDTSARRSHDIT